MSRTIIAMWSGPRSLSTAMMRSFENRADTDVFDEPFYAHYLEKTGIDHPGRDLVLRSQNTNWNDIVDICIGSIPNGKSIWYQKHMAQHNLKGCSINWISSVKNCVLIRDPLYVISSYGEQFPVDNEDLLGYKQQSEIVQYIEKEIGETPPIIDATDILKDPENSLKSLCHEMDIKFSHKMLKWPSGGRDSDGVWAPYWYNSVNNSTGFKPFQEKDIKLDKKLSHIYKSCMKYYQDMYEKRIKV